MSDQRPGMFVPALIGGGIAGIFSAIPILNCLCCLWIIGGALLASYLLIKDSPVALTAGDGAIVGIFTGIIAAIVDAFISIPFHAINSRFVQRAMEAMSEYFEEPPPGWDTMFEGGVFEPSAGMFMIGLLVSVIIFAVLGALGGIIGISLFKKRKTQENQGAIDAPKDSGHHQP